MITIKGQIPTSYTLRCCKCGTIIRYELDDIESLAQGQKDFDKSNKLELAKYKYGIYCPHCKELNYHYITSEARVSFDEK